MTTVRVVLAPGAEFTKERTDATVQPVHGVHWLVDFYALLKVDKEADEQTIRKAIRTLRTKTHTDVTDRILEEAQEVTAHYWELADQAEAIMLDAPQRLVYEERLQWFEQERPYAISDDGRPIVCLMYHDLDVMKINHPFRSFTVEKAEAQARKDSGYNPDEHEERLKKLVDFDDASMLLEYWLKRWGYLGKFETYLWYIAGFFGMDASPNLSRLLHIEPENYQACVAKQIEDKKRQVRSTIEVTHRLALEGTEVVPMAMLMPARDDTESDEVADIDAPLFDEEVKDDALAQAFDRLQHSATSRIEGTREHLEAVGLLKAETLKEIVSLAPYEGLNSCPAPTYLFCLTGMEGKEDEVTLAIGGPNKHDMDYNMTALGHDVRKIATTYDGQAHIVNVPVIYGLACPAAILVSAAERFFEALEQPEEVQQPEEAQQSEESEA